VRPFVATTGVFSSKEATRLAMCAEGRTVVSELGETALRLTVSRVRRTREEEEEEDEAVLDVGEGVGDADFDVILG
jgi:hypothetical protein